MSSEQATLSEATAGAQPEPQPGWSVSSPDEGRRCRNCGAHVDPDTVRVFGDNDGRLWACIRCVSHAALRDGAGADPEHEWRVDR